MQKTYKNSWLAAYEDKEKSYPLNSAKDLDPLIERIGDAHFVLLGEASHGTHECYAWRTAITKRLILEKGFNFLAVEGDWPDCYKLNSYIKGYFEQDKTVPELLQEFRRWPTWMWANWEIASLITWLKQYNISINSGKKVGFYGLDVYSLWESIYSIAKYLEKTDPYAASLARKTIDCFEPYSENEHRYNREYFSLPDSCREALIQLLSEIRKNPPIYDNDPEAALNAEQNALIVVNAEEYYNSMMNFNDNSWNLRATHMTETLNRLIKFHGSDSKAIVWEHNNHIGDARFTGMKKAGMINIGQLVRESRGEDDVVLVGFGSHHGTVVAGKEWNAPMEVMSLPAALQGSVEEILHHESAENKLLIFNVKNKNERFNRELLHRAIGVVYNPEHDMHQNYIPTILNARYDAFLYLDKTRALYPMHIQPDGNKIPETYPFTY